MHDKITSCRSLRIYVVTQQPIWLYGIYAAPQNGTLPNHCNAAVFQPHFESFEHEWKAVELLHEYIKPRNMSQLLPGNWDLITQGSRGNDNFSLINVEFRKLVVGSPNLNNRIITFFHKTRMSHDFRYVKLFWVEKKIFSTQNWLEKICSKYYVVWDTHEIKESYTYVIKARHGTRYVFFF